METISLLDSDSHSGTACHEPVKRQRRGSVLSRMGMPDSTPGNAVQWQAPLPVLHVTNTRQGRASKAAGTATSRSSNPSTYGAAGGTKDSDEHVVGVNGRGGTASTSGRGSDPTENGTRGASAASPAGKRKRPPSKASKPPQSRVKPKRALDAATQPTRLASDGSLWVVKHAPRNEVQLIVNNKKVRDEMRT